MVDIPNEILAIIINTLAPSENDSQTSAALGSCRLVSHRFCALATPVLFPSIRFTDNKGDDTMATIQTRAEMLTQILTNDKISASVHTLTLSFCSDNLIDSTFGRIIAPIFHRLPHIQKFVLEASNTDFYEVVDAAEFSSMEKDLISAIRALLRSPNLTTLNLYNISDFPFTLITACPNLKSLCLSHVEFSYLDGTSHPNICYLDSLEVDGFGLTSLGPIVGSYIPFAESFSRLKRFTIHDEDMMTTYGRNIALLSSQTLTELVYRKVLWDILEVAPYDLSCFPLLRHFKIRLCTTSRDNITLHNFLKNLLYFSSSCSHIETLDIGIKWYCNPDDEADKEYLFSPDVGWSTLDEILASAGFTSLRHLVFDFHLTFDILGAWGPNIRALELKKKLILPCVDALFPKFRASLNAQRTLEIQVTFT